MPAKMTGRQLAFYRELYAPFRDDELSTKPGRGSKEFTWLDKRALMNRLDTVCGPHGWYPEYRQFGPGLICALTIFCPDVTADGFVRITKEDGAGPEEMSEIDNDIKSNFTNALRRSAQDAWGIGRYLYGKGIAGFLDPTAQAAPKVHNQTDVGNQAPPALAPAPAPAAKQPAATSREIPKGGMQLPRSGSGVWPWGKELEKIFETKILDGMIDAGERLGFGRTTRQWDEKQTKILCLDAIGFVKTLPNYAGQFDYVVAPGEQADPAPVTAAASALRPVPQSLMGLP
jgi:Rad52/22 family double-strand break repair protein